MYKSNRVLFQRFYESKCVKDNAFIVFSFRFSSKCFQYRLEKMKSNGMKERKPKSTLCSSFQKSVETLH